MSTSGIDQMLRELRSAAAQAGGGARDGGDAASPAGAPDFATMLRSQISAQTPGTWACAYSVANISMTLSCSAAFAIIGGTLGVQLMSRPYARSGQTSYIFVRADAGP